MAQPLHILWQDDHLVAVYKPAGWLVHRTGLDAGETRFVMQTLRDQLGRHVFPVHRLDKGTCGVLVMALHSDAARALSQSFENQATHKVYIAMVQAHVFGMFAIVKPGRQGRAKAVGAATAVVQNQHGGIVFAGRHQQLQGKNGFAHCPDCRVCQRTACPKVPINPFNRLSILIAACAWWTGAGL